MRAQTTDATPTELLIDGADRFVLDDNHVYLFDLMIVAKRTDVAGDVSTYRRQVYAKRGVGVGTVIVGTPDTFRGEGVDPHVESFFAGEAR